MAQLSVSNLGGRKNFIINGAMDIWQNATSYSAITTSAWLADMFQFGINTDGSMNITRDSINAGVLSPFTPLYSIKCQPQAADTSISTAQYSMLQTAIEGYNYRRLKERTATLSFFVYSNKAGIYCIGFRNLGSDRAYIAEYTINQANTWEKKSITITFNQSGGTEDYTNGQGIRINWVLAAGSTYQTTPNVWQNGNYFSTSNQVNFMDNITNVFHLTAVQLELGSVATDFEYRAISEELELCQRYFEKSYDISVVPGSAGSTAGADSFVASVGNYRAAIRYKVNKRSNSNPPVAYSPVTGASGYIRNETSGADVVQAGWDMRGETGARATIAAVDQNIYYFHWAVDARI